jgi:hypothetical protein
MSPRAADIVPDAIRDALEQHRQVEAALRQRIAALDAEVRGLRLEIDRLRVRPHADRDKPTEALEPRHA